MENTEKVEPTVTEPIVKDEKSEELIPQSQVNGIVAKETKAAIEKMLKDLGVEDVKSAKEGLNKFKELQEAQKTEAEKLAERNAELEATLTQAQQEVRNSKIERVLDDILSELDIEKTYAKTILKLTDLSSVEEINHDNLKEVIENTINEELPMLVKGETLKIGAVPMESDKLPAGTNDYLKEKYKNNKYFTGN